MVVGWSVNLTSLTDSTISFFTAFCLEALLFSVEVWAKLPVGIVLVMILLLISWCVWTTLEAKADFSILSRVNDLKDRLVGFTRSLRGKTSNRLRRPRGPRVSTSSTLVNQIGGSGCGPPDATAMEMDRFDNKESGGQV